MEILLLIILVLIILVGVGCYYICSYFIRKYFRRKLEIAYESERLEDQDLVPIYEPVYSFDEAVIECFKAIYNIYKFDEEFAKIDKEIKEKQNVNGRGMNLLNILFKSGYYKEGTGSGTERYVFRKYRIWWRRGLVSLILLILSPFLGLLLNFMSFGSSLILMALLLVYLLYIPMKAPQKERKQMTDGMIKYPWRFNTQPFGSEMYNLWQNGLILLERTHQQYYHYYIRYFREAEDYLRRQANPQSRDMDIMKYLEGIKKEIWKRTPMNRLRKFKKECERNPLKGILPDSMISVIAEAQKTGNFISDILNEIIRIIKSIKSGG